MKLFEKKIPLATEPTDSSLQTANQTHTDRMLCLALDIGEHMLRNGGEIHRIEDTLERICLAYGAAHVEIFTIPSLVMAAVRMPDGSYSSQIRRVYASNKDLYRLEQFNAISRRICTEKPSFDEVERMIRSAKQARPYSSFWVILGSVLASGGFAVFFGGSLRDGVAAALVGLILATLIRIESHAFNQMVKTVLLSFVLGILCFGVVEIGIGQDLGFVTIGAIMLLIPGLDMGNALRDLLCGNLLSGTLRTVQSLLLAVMISFGYAASLLITGGLAA